MLNTVRQFGRRLRDGRQESPQREHQRRLSASIAEIFGSSAMDSKAVQEKLQLIEEVKTNQEQYTVAERDGVRLLLVEAEQLTNQNGVTADARKESFLISAENKQTGQWEIAGTRSIIIDEANRNVHLEHITVYDGEQAPEISSGSHRSKGVGVGSVLTLVDYLNHPMKAGQIDNADTERYSMNGWTTSVDALNRGFNEKFKAIFQASDPDSWDRMKGTVPSPQEAEARLSAYYAARGERLVTRQEEQQPPAQAA